MIPSWISQSRKAKVAMVSLLLIVATRLGGKLGLPQADMDAIVQALQVLGGIWIAGIALEDAGGLSAAQINLPHLLSQAGQSTPASVSPGFPPPASSPAANLNPMVPPPGPPPN